MLEAIRIIKDGIVDEVSGNIIAELKKRGYFCGFSEKRLQSFLEVMRNKVEYDLKYSQKSTGQLEECSDSKVMQSVMNGRTFKYHFWGCIFHMLPQSYTFSQGIFLNNLFQVWLIVNQRYHVPLSRYINHSGGVSHFFRGIKVLGDMKCLSRSVKRAEEAVGMWTEDNHDVERVNSLYIMVYGRFNFKINKRFDSLIWSSVVRGLYMINRRWCYNY